MDAFDGSADPWNQNAPYSGGRREQLGLASRDFTPSLACGNSPQAGTIWPGQGFFLKLYPETQAKK
jgi:hypothetical protein